MSNKVFEEHYQKMDMDQLIEASNSPHKLNINGIPSLIKELEKRKALKLKKNVENFYTEATNIKSDDIHKSLSLNIWLNVLLIGLFISLIKSIIEVYQEISKGINFSMENNNDIYIFFGGEVFMIIMSIILISMMLSFKRGFPKTMIFYIIISVLLSITINIEFYLIEKSLLFAQIAFGVIWIGYLLFSKKVKETFIK